MERVQQCMLNNHAKAIKAHDRRLTEVLDESDVSAKTCETILEFLFKTFPEKAFGFFKEYAPVEDTYEDLGSEATQEDEDINEDIAADDPEGGGFLTADDEDMQDAQDQDECIVIDDDDLPDNHPSLNQ